MKQSLENLYHSALTLLTPLKLEETYETIVTEANRQIDTSNGLLFLPEGRSAKMAYASYKPSESFCKTSESLAKKALKKTKLFTLSRNELKKIAPQTPRQELCALFVIPLVFDKEVLGVLILKSSNEVIALQKKRHVVQIFAGFASLTLRNVQLYDEMEKALETKGLFLSMASHELKTPLTTISGYAQLMYKNQLQEKEVKKEWVEKMRDQTFRLSRLINKLLEVNDLRMGKLKLNWEVCNIGYFLKIILEEFKLKYPQRQFLYTNLWDTTKDQMIIDREKIHKVISYIMLNAIKFSPDDKPISLTLKEEGEYVLLTVQDYGMGMSEDELDQAFNEFFKSKTHTQEGMGLGLFISRRIVEAHRGEIEMESQEGKGTVVRIYLPRKMSN